MKIVSINDKQKTYFTGLDPLEIMDASKAAADICLGAVIDDKKDADIPAGLMIVRFLDEAVLIRWLYVAQRYRGRGIGEELLDAAFEMAGESGKDRICAYMPDEYGKAYICSGGEEFFRLNGFTYEEGISGIAGKVLTADAGAGDEESMPYGIFDKVLQASADEEPLYEAAKEAAAERKIGKDDLVLTVKDIEASAISDSIAAGNKAVPISDLTVAALGRGIKRCVQKHPYDVFEGDLRDLDPDWFDPELSTCILEDGEVTGLFLVHMEDDGSFWPEYLFEVSKQPGPRILMMLERSANSLVRKYPPKTRVVIRMKKAETKNLMKKLFPYIKK